MHKKPTLSHQISGHFLVGPRLLPGPQQRILASMAVMVHLRSSDKKRPHLVSSQVPIDGRGMLLAEGRTRICPTLFSSIDTVGLFHQALLLWDYSTNHPLSTVVIASQSYLKLTLS